MVPALQRDVHRPCGPVIRSSDIRINGYKFPVSFPEFIISQTITDGTYG